MTVFEDEIVKNKEYANLIFTGPWALTNEIMLQIMQNFKFDFFKKKFVDQLGCTSLVPFPQNFLREFFQCIDEY